MEVFIGNLSAEAKLIEIHHILGEHDMHSDFTTHEGKACDHSKYHFVVVKVVDREQGNALIGRLNGLDFCQRQLDVREYIHRDQNLQHWDGDDRRINEQIALAL